MNTKLFPVYSVLGTPPLTWSLTVLPAALRLPRWITTVRLQGVAAFQISAVDLIDIVIGISLHIAIPLLIHSFFFSSPILCYSPNFLGLPPTTGRLTLQKSICTDPPQPAPQGFEKIHSLLRFFSHKRASYIQSSHFNLSHVVSTSRTASPRPSAALWLSTTSSFAMVPASPASALRRWPSVPRTSASSFLL